jgi:hypothetical protein
MGPTAIPKSPSPGMKGRLPLSCFQSGSVRSTLNVTNLVNSPDGSTRRVMVMTATRPLCEPTRTSDKAGMIASKLSRLSEIFENQYFRHGELIKELCRKLVSSVANKRIGIRPQLVYRDGTQSFM